MPFGFFGTGSHAGIATEALSDLVRAPQRPIPFAFALAGVGEAIAMPAQEIAPWPVQLGDAPPTGDAVHHTWTDEIGPRATKAARHADDADGLLNVLPLAARNARAIGEMQPVGLGA